MRYITYKKNINEDMKMKFDTKMRKSGGSIITSIPSLLIKALDIDPEGTIEWNIDIGSNSATVTLNFPEKR